MYLGFEKIIRKKIESQKQIQDIDKQKQQLLEGLEQLRKRIHGIDIIRKNFDAKKELKDIEKSIHEYDKQRKNLNDSISDFMNFLKSK